MALEKVSLETELYRVGRIPDPWAWTDWAYAGSDGTFGNRWDDAYGRFRVLYASTQRLGAFVEVLAPLRPDPEIVAAIDEMETLEGDDESTLPGQVPLTWCRERVITKGVATDLQGSFVTVGSLATIGILRTALAALILHHNLTDLDAAAIRLSAPRAFTQQISSYLAEQRDDEGQLFAGIYYLSRLGDEIENWAIFEREAMNGTSPVLSVERDTLDPADEDLQRAFEILGLSLA
jgi:hypothetical protein